MRDSTSSDFWLQWAFFAAGSVTVLLEIVKGWRRGVMRQIMHLAALIVCYAAAWFGGPLVAPVMRPLGYPDFILSGIGGFALALVVFILFTSAGALLFKKTSQQSVWIVRLGYGLTGSALGLVIGLILVWGALIVIRLLGTLAEGEVSAASRLAAKKAGAHEAGSIQRPNLAVLGVAAMKHSLDHGVAANIVRETDPVPAKTYAIINKVTAVLSSPESGNRMLNFPGAQPLITNPKMIELRDDPEIAKQIKSGDIMGLLKNRHVISVANDPELHEMLKKFELEKALDYSLNTSQKGND